MGEWRYESGYGKSSHPGCDEYVLEEDLDYVTSDGEVRRRTTWDCPIHGEVIEDIPYPVFDDDDRKFIWGAFLAAQAAGVIPADMVKPKNADI